MKFSVATGFFALAASVAAVSTNDLGINIDLSQADHICEKGQLKCCGVFDYLTELTGIDLEAVEDLVGSPLQTTIDLDPSALGVGTFGNCVDLPLIGDASLIFEGGLLKTECPGTVACCHEGDDETQGPDGLIGFVIDTVDHLSELLAFLNPGGV
ncbi:hypothetical protein FQN54_005351 [Arachnomyces sp. PD_36]|nr:hypothetical protein FQN54_005351 [Arachnomyces sp. PD_36]